MSAVDLAVIVVYIVGIVALGCYFVRRERTTEDFFLGGRRLPWWAVGISIYATQLSAISFMGAPARAYKTNWTWFPGSLTMLVVMPFIAYVFLPFFRRVPTTSAYEYLERRFHPRLRDYGALAFVAMQVGRMGVVLYLPALALAELTGVSVVLLIVVLGALIVLYTVLGGIEAVIWTDVAQVVVLVGGAIFAAVYLIRGIDGGLARIVEVGAADHKFVFARGGFDPTVDVLFFVLLGNVFERLIPYGSDQAVIQRYLTTSSEKEARRSILLNSVMGIPLTAMLFFLGTGLYVFYKVNPDAVVPGAGFDADRIYPYFIVTQLPQGVSGLVIAAIFAASMSSLDSSLNSVATVCVNDVYRRYIDPKAADRRCLVLARVLTVFWGALATAVAVYMALQLQANPEHRGAWHLFRQIFALLGGGLLGVFALGILVRRATWQGAIAGIVVSAGVLYLVKTRTVGELTLGLVRSEGKLTIFTYSLIAIATCALAGWLVSLVFRPQPSEVTDRFTYWGIRRAATRDEPA